MTLLIDRSQLLAFRARRQHLAPDSKGRSPEDVLAILRALQPFPPRAGSMPGSPPEPSGRVLGFEAEWSQRWRARGQLVKGRFMNGNVAYVSRADLALYAAAFRYPLPDPMPQPVRRVLNLVERHGPIYRSALQDLAELERQRFRRALTALSRAFVVVEMQREVEWDSPWDLYRRAYLDADLHEWEQSEAQAEVLRRFTQAFGPASVGEMSDWSGWRPRRIHELLDHLLDGGIVTGIEVEGESELAYIASVDVDALETVAPTSSFLVALPSDDPLVTPQRSRLRARYRPEALPYCLGVIVVDGEMVGAGWGHYKRRYIHIEELSLEPSIVHDPSWMDRVLEALEAHVGATSVPVHIYSINGAAEAPWTAEILTRNGYVRKAGYYVKE